MAGAISSVALAEVIALRRLVEDVGDDAVAQGADLLVD